MATRVCRLDPDNDRFHNFGLVDSNAARIYQRFDGTPIRSAWERLEIMAVDTDDELALLADHALLGTVPIFSERAVEALTDMLQPNGELLPLIYPRCRYFAYNITAVIDALDEKQSKVHRFSSGQVMSIDEFAFRVKVLRGKTIFKIPQLPRASVFVTQDFVDRVGSTGLTGFDFREVWEAEAAA